MARCLGTLLAVLASIAVIQGACGQDTKKLDIDLVFKKLDANSDGKLVKTEFLRLADRFKEKDKAREKLTSTYDKIDPSNIGMTKDQFRRYLDSVKKKESASRN